jgi:hypothetical protein
MEEIVMMMMIIIIIIIIPNSNDIYSTVTGNLQK